jgi:hypothetical protein
MPTVDWRAVPGRHAITPSSYRRPLAKGLALLHPPVCARTDAERGQVTGCVNCSMSFGTKSSSFSGSESISHWSCGMGMITLGTSMQVLVQGNPAPRAGDLGLAPTCAGIMPFYRVFGLFQGVLPWHARRAPYRHVYRLHAVCRHGHACDRGSHERRAAAEAARPRDDVVPLFRALAVCRLDSVREAAVRCERPPRRASGHRSGVTRVRRSRSPGPRSARPGRIPPRLRTTR